MRSSWSGDIRRPARRAPTLRPRTTRCSTARRTSCWAPGLTIAGAMYCLSFTRMPYFQSMGIPCAVGIVAGVAVALTLGPAIVTVAGRFGLLEPKRAMRIRDVAAHRHHGGPLAGAHPGGIPGAGTGRARRAAGLPDQLRRHPLHPGVHPGQRGTAGGHPALLDVPDEPRGAARRGRPRPAEPLGLPDPRPARKEGLRGGGCRARPGGHPARRSAHRAHVDPVPDQHAGRRSAAEHEADEGSRCRYAHAGRRDRHHSGDDEADVRADVASSPASPAR